MTNLERIDHEIEAVLRMEAVCPGIVHTHQQVVDHVGRQLMRHGLSATPAYISERVTAIMGR